MRSTRFIWLYTFGLFCLFHYCFLTDFYGLKCEESSGGQCCLTGIADLTVQSEKLENIFHLVYSGETSQANYLPNVELYTCPWFGSLSNADFMIQYVISAIETNFTNNFVSVSGGFPPIDISLTPKPLLGKLDPCTIRLILCTRETKRIIRLSRLRSSKFSKCRVIYYPNSVASKQILLLSGDIERNPGWNVSVAPNYLQDFVKSLDKGLNNMKVAHINIRSIRNKIEEVKLLLYVCRLDILAITETHLNREISNSQLEVENYKMVRRDRSSGMVEGGCLVSIANHLCFTRLKSFESTDIEGIWLKIMFESSAFIVGSIYRPRSDSEFFQRFYIMLEKVWLKYRNVIVIGDLNADFTRNSGEIKSAMGKRLHNILQHFDYSLVNDQPTRITSETSTLIDLVIASKPNTIKCTKTLELGISDHLLVYASVKNKIKRPPPKVVTATILAKIIVDTACVKQNWMFLNKNNP